LWKAVNATSATRNETVQGPGVAAAGARAFVRYTSPRSIVNTTRLNTSAIASRAFTTVLLHYSRASLVEADAFAQRNGMTFHFTAIPPEYPYAGPLGFTQHSMSALFGYGQRCASSSHIWLDLRAAIGRAQRTVLPASTPDVAPCPTQD
jgi:hypothetical protein